VDEQRVAKELVAVARELEGGMGDAKKAGQSMKNALRNLKRLPRLVRASGEDFVDTKEAEKVLRMSIRYLVEAAGRLKHATPGDFDAMRDANAIVEFMADVVKSNLK